MKNLQKKVLPNPTQLFNDSTGENARVKKEGAIVHAVACIACGCGERAHGMEFLLFLCLAVGKVKTK